MDFWDAITLEAADDHDGGMDGIAGGAVRLGIG
jgi:hypothetical protein